MKDFIDHFDGPHIFATKSDIEHDAFRHFHADSIEEAAQQGLFSWNNTEFRKGVFFTVNELHKSKDPERQRTKKMFHRARAIWCEDDEVRDNPREDWPLEPTLIVESSPGKFHYYWTTSTHNLNEWEEVQEIMVEFFGSDPNATKDCNRVLRLPHSWHLKKEPFQVQGYELNEKPYKWPDLLYAFKQWASEHKRKAQPKKKAKDKGDADYSDKGATWKELDKAYKEGHTHGPSSRGAMKLINEGKSIIEAVDELKKRYPNIKEKHHAQSAATAYQKKKAEDKERGLSDEDDVKYFEVNEIVGNRAVRSKPVGDDVLFPDNKMGRLTRSLLNTWWVPNTMIASLAARSIIAYLAGGNYRSNLGDRVNIQQVAVGETGCGKDMLMKAVPAVIQEVFQTDIETMRRLLYGVIDEAGSAEGIDDRIRSMEDKHDLIFARDEIGEMLQMAAKGNMQQQSVLNYALKMFTKADVASNERVKAARRGDDKVSKVMYAGHFIISGATTEQLIVDGLKSSMIETGIMSRMMLFDATSYRQRRLRVCESLDIDSDIMDSIKKIIDTKKMTKGHHTMPSARVYNPKLVTFTDEAVELCFTESEKDDNRMGDYRGIWTRRVVNAKKYAMIEAILEEPAKPIVTVENLNRQLLLMDSCCQYTTDLFKDGVSENIVDAASKRVVARAKRQYAVDPEKWFMRRFFMNDHSMKQVPTPRLKGEILDQLVDDGYLEVHEKHNRRGKPTISYRYLNEKPS